MPNRILPSNFNPLNCLRANLSRREKKRKYIKTISTRKNVNIIDNTPRKLKEQCFVEKEKVAREWKVRSREHSNRGARVERKATGKAVSGPLIRRTILINHVT